MVSRAEGLAGLPGLSFSGEVVAVLLGPHPALGARLAPGPCKHTDHSEEPTVRMLKKKKNQYLTTVLSEGANLEHGAGKPRDGKQSGQGLGQAVEPVQCTKAPAPGEVAVNPCLSGHWVMSGGDRSSLSFSLLTEPHVFMLHLPSGDIFF